MEEEPKARKAKISVDWTPERIATLQSLWIRGETTSAIAKALGYPDGKNAVISKARREKLPGRPNPSVRQEGKQNAFLRPTAKPVEAKKPKKAAEPREERERGPEGSIPLKPDNRALNSPVWTPLEGSTPVNLMDRTGCCFIVTKDSPYLYCNEPKPEGRSYCPTHQTIMEPKRNDQANPSFRHKLSHVRLAPAGRINFR